jgi:hypothetical protein
VFTCNDITDVDYQEVLRVKGDGCLELDQHPGFHYVRELLLVKRFFYDSLENRDRRRYEDTNNH